MTEMTVTEFSRNLRAIFDRIEHNGEEVILIRNNHRIARIIPGSPSLSALEAMNDLYSTISEDAAVDWDEDRKVKSSIDEEIHDPWDS